MWLKISLIIFLPLLLILGQFSLISALPGSLATANFILVCLIFVLVLVNWSWAAWWWLAAGLFTDIIGLSIFGLNLLSYGLTFLIIYWLLLNFFTNRSLYSFLLLNSLALIIFESLKLFWNWLFNAQAITNFTWGYWLILGYKLLWSWLLTVIIFYLLTFISRRFLPVFIRK